jgi:hypothetical protein
VVGLEPSHSSGRNIQGLVRDQATTTSSIPIITGSHVPDHNPEDDPRKDQQQQQQQQQATAVNVKEGGSPC